MYKLQTKVAEPFGSAAREPLCRPLPLAARGVWRRARAMRQSSQSTNWLRDRICGYRAFGVIRVSKPSISVFVQAPRRGDRRCRLPATPLPRGPRIRAHLGLATVHTFYFVLPLLSKPIKHHDEDDNRQWAAHCAARSLRALSGGPGGQYQRQGGGGKRLCEPITWRGCFRGCSCCVSGACGSVQTGCSGAEDLGNCCPPASASGPRGPVHAQCSCPQTLFAPAGALAARG